MACPRCGSSACLIRIGSYACSECWAEWVECECGEPACSVCCEHIYEDGTCRCTHAAMRLSAESDPRWGMH